MASLENTHHYLMTEENEDCENVELTVSKNCDPLFSVMIPF